MHYTFQHIGYEQIEFSNMLHASIFHAKQYNDLKICKML